MGRIGERMRSIDPRWGPILTVLMLLVAVAGVVGHSFRLVNGVPGDYYIFSAPAAHFVTGQWSSVYVDPSVTAGPFELAFLSFPAPLGIPDLPIAESMLAWRTIAIVAGLLGVGTVILLARRMLRDLAPTWRLPLASAVGALVALSGLIAQAMSYAHPAELAIPLLWLGSALLARNNRPLAAGIVLALSPGWELWGLLGAPVLLLAPRLRMRTVVLSGIGVVGVLALTYLPFIATGHFTMFDFRWPIRGTTLIHLLFPGLTAFPWPLRLLQGAFAIICGSVIALALRGRMDAVWLAPLAVCIARLSLDPTIQDYYALPSVIPASFGLVLSLAQERILPAIGCLALYVVLVEFGGLTAAHLITALVITVIIAVLVIGAHRSRRARSIVTA